MAAVLINGAASIQILSTTPNGQTVSNTVHVVNPGQSSAPDLATLTGLASEFWTWISGTYPAMCAVGTTINATIAKQVSTDPKNLPPIEAQHVVAIAGSRSIGTVPCPQSLCAVASFKTILASRKFRGHNFLPPAADSLSIAGDNIQLSQAYGVACTAYVAKLQAGAGPTPSWTGTHLASYTLSIYSKKAAEADPTAATAAVSTVVLKPRASYLYSRSHGGT